MAVDLGGLSVIVAEMARSETQVTFHYPYMPPAQPAVQSDRKIGNYTFAEVIVLLIFWAEGSA